MRGIVVVVSMLASPVLAEGWAMREGDTAFGIAELDLRLRGEILTFYDGGQSEFYQDGRYTYTYADAGGTGYGYFEVKPDSSVCIEFVNGFSRCDAYVTDAQERLVVITEKGDRFPVRE